MRKKYLYSFKKNIVLMIKENKLSTKAVALQYNIPIKTLEKWITSYNKNPKVFNKIDVIDDGDYYVINN